MLMNTSCRSVLFFIAIFFFSGILQAQSINGNTLYQTLKTNDSLMFEVGFNTCDISQFEKLLSNDFEFYHDISGTITSKQNFVDDLRNGLCKLDYRPRRELVKGSLEVYPLKKNGKLYGAIQSGRHRFFAKEEGKPEYFTSIARFTHLWLLENGKWKFARGLSYDHQTVDETATAMGIPDAEMLRWLKENNVPALGLGIIRDGVLKQVKVYGELEKGKPAPYNTIFNVASLTKPVTAMVALKLASQGQWKLDEPLAKYWTDPDVKKDSRSKKLTTRHVLSQQSGFPNWRSGKLAFEFEPGTRYQYSGEGMEYLQKALEKKFNTTLDKLADTLVFKPLGMVDTRYTWDKSVDENRFARWHDAKGNVYPTTKNTKATAADDLLTTVEDYGRFVVAAMNGTGLSDEIFGEMTGHQVQTKKQKYFGLGWELYDFGAGDYALSHGGADKGVQAQVFAAPKSGNGIVIFTNVDDGYKLYERLIKTYLGEDGEKIIGIEMGK